MIKNTFHPLQVPDTAHVEHGQLVLVRTEKRKWVAAFYSHYDKEANLHHCVVGGLWYEQCIPYNDETKHLLDTTNDCDEYYKTWE